ncbi:MAG: hypothetical protein GX535_04770 [Xanthomonadaceae bacterium]|nr:hypothetical protein [Xanthomonadaceae bacterium]
MLREYVFRGERKPYAPDPEELRAREEARREAEQLVNLEPELEEIVPDAEIAAKISDYQTGGWYSYGAEATIARADQKLTAAPHADR